MNDRTHEQLLDAWMDLGPTVAPARVAEAARLEARSTRQTATLSRWLPRRYPEMNTMAKLALSVAAVAVAALIGISMLGGGNIGGPDLADPTPEGSDDGAEALVRAWVDAVNRADRNALISMTAERVTLDTVPADGADAVDYVLDDWCHMTINSVERTGDSFLLNVTFRDTPDGTCVAGPPGTTGSLVLEVGGGKVTRIP